MKDLVSVDVLRRTHGLVQGFFSSSSELAHARRRTLHFDVTEHPTAQWTAQQLSGGVPWETPPRFLIRDRDRLYGEAFKGAGRLHRHRGNHHRASEPFGRTRSPNGAIGSIRRECLAHVVALNERHLQRILGDYLEHYHRWRCHRSLDMDSPEPRPVQGPACGQVVEVSEAGGLYRHCERRAA